MSYAVQFAYKNEMPELETWADEALTSFPDSYFTRIDTTYILAAYNFERQRFDKAVAYGEEYLQARRDYVQDDKGRTETYVGVLQRNDGGNELDVRVALARSYLRKDQVKKALLLLENWPWEETDARQVKNFLVAVQECKEIGDANILPMLMECRDLIRKPIPSAERAQERVAMFDKLCTIRDNEPPQETSPELLCLANKVKTVLEKLPPDDPIAVELKSSEAYQKIAWLIEQGIV